MKDFIISCLISCIYYTTQTMFSKYLLKTLWNLSQGFMEFVLRSVFIVILIMGMCASACWLCCVCVCGLVFEQIELIKISRLI